MKNNLRALLFILIFTLGSCAQKLENTTEKMSNTTEEMANTTEKMQVATEKQIGDMLVYIDSLNGTMQLMEQHTLVLLTVMQQMQMSLQELTKIAPMAQSMIDSVQPLIQTMLKEQDTPNRDTDDLSDLFDKEDF